ncbi:GlxA family transcriptional regulator [Undibacterium terreum]|uniref:AraC family transcriptional regulator n=1 Tax=Undibacterium terreum TaxID=1224302 RepID=A0A916U9D8_9BURK|nr:helix-turn-helix domain-containing protein [Undibacterium terreum]GGC64012.1 AraC family transcriptional regulator [Undibacterium terreum]
MDKNTVPADPGIVPNVPDVRFLLLPLPDFTMLPFGGFLDKLRFSADEEDYSQQRYCTWQVLGREMGHVRSSSGVAVEVQVTPEQLNFSDVDYLVVFGGRTARLTQKLASGYKALLRQAAAHGVKLVSIDNACFLLAACGLLAGHKVAIHWRHVQEFRAAFPLVDVVEEQIYCFDGNRISCAGGSAAIDLAVEILTRECGRERALKGLADMLVDEARSNRHRLKSLDKEADAGRHVGRAIGLMRGFMAEKKTTDEIAALIGVSRRQLDRLFMESYGQTAHDYWRELRLQHVRWRLLNSDHGLAGLAYEVGIQDSSYLCKVFRKRFGESPDALRRREGAQAL